MRDMLVSGHVTLGNGSCNLCHNKIARQVARKMPSVTATLNSTANNEKHPESDKISLLTDGGRTLS